MTNSILILDGLTQIAPVDFDEYQKIEKERSCERLLHLCIGSIIDICKLFVAGGRSGLPSEENDLFDKMRKNGIISKTMCSTLKEIRGFGDILIHEYAIVDDKIVFRVLKAKLKDFKKFKKEILRQL